MTQPDPYPGWARWGALHDAEMRSPAEYVAGVERLALDGHAMSRLAAEFIVPGRLQRPAAEAVRELAERFDPAEVRMDFGRSVLTAALRMAEQVGLPPEPAIERLRTLRAQLTAATDRLFGPLRDAATPAQFTQRALIEGHFQRRIALPPDHPERLAHAAELRFRASLRGAGALLSRREWALPAGQSEFDLLQARLFDAVESGRYDEGIEVAETLEAAMRDKPAWIATFVAFYIGMLWLGTTATAGRPLSRTRIETLAEMMRAREGHLVNTIYAEMFQAVVDLLDPFATPPRPVRTSATSYIQQLAPSTWMALMPVRLALAADDVALARHVLDLRRQAGFRCFVDDFLHSRVRRLEGDAEEANRLLGEAVVEARRCRAEGRLALEMQLCRRLAWNELAGAPTAAPPRAVRSAAPTKGDADTPLLGSTPIMARLRQAIAAYADSDLPVLVTGETGSGKELVARALHAASPRARLPLVTLNCAALSETLLESELFGHARGSFSGAESERAGLVREAGAGTLVLDEIGDASPRFQSSLLRLLDRGEYRMVGTDRALAAHCRFIACTNADLDRAVAAGRFRLDLLHRLRCLHIALPPLRERAADIPLLAAHFALQERVGAAVELDGELLALLGRLPWPGNVRELRNAIARLLALHRDARSLGLRHWRAAELPEPARAGGDPATAAVAPPTTRAERLALIERLVGERPLARRQLVERTGLAPRTISLYVAELIAAGRLVSEGSGAAAVYRRLGA